MQSRDQKNNFSLWGTNLCGQNCSTWTCNPRWRIDLNLAKPWMLPSHRKAFKVQNTQMLRISLTKSLSFGFLRFGFLFLFVLPNIIKIIQHSWKTYLVIQNTTMDIVVNYPLLILFIMYKTIYLLLMLLFLH